jgi:GNAT superfamily N-acetyltransferase
LKKNELNTIEDLIKRADLNKMGMKGDWQKEGYTLHVEGQPEYGESFTIYAKKKGRQVGFAGFFHGGESLHPEDVSVHPNHQRKGLATAMYQHAERLTGVKTKPAEDNSPDAQALWSQKDRPFGKSEPVELAELIKRAKTPKEPKALKTPKEPEAPLTISGLDVNPNPAIKSDNKSKFDKGVLHTPKGSFPVYTPDHDDSDYKQILNRPDIKDLHDNTMKNWFKLHNIHKTGGKIPEELIAHSVLFSILSANTPVPMQELGYSRLVDTMKKLNLDPRSKDFAEAFAPGGAGAVDWIGSDKPDQLPDHSKDYWTGQAGPAITQQSLSEGTGRGPGDIKVIPFKNQVIKKLQNYPAIHAYLSNLVNTHKTDSRAMTQDLMDAKAGSKTKAGKGHVAGLPVGIGSKIARYMFSLLGGSNTVVPDTHFIRHTFGLNSKVDSKTSEYLKQVLWNPQNHHLLSKLDEHYIRNHPAVQHVQDEYFKGLPTEDAAFPAFWLHWLTIAPHEKLRGIGKPSSAKNLTDHTPYWDTANEILDRYGLGLKKKESLNISKPLRTAAAAIELEQKLGPAVASMVFYSHLLPQLTKKDRKLSFRDYINLRGKKP